MDEFVKAACIDRLEGWELVEFLQVPTADILEYLLDNDIINDDNLSDVLEFIGIK